ncbi:unnamed protein product [Chrysoparadoxa australica]
MGSDEDHPDNKKVEGDENFSVGKDRKCTDILFLLLLMAAWVAMTALGLVVLGVIESEHLKPGNPYRLINGIDAQGRICGVDDGVKELPITYHLPKGAGICVDSCPAEDDATKFYCLDDATIRGEVYLPDGTFDTVKGWQYVSSGECLHFMASREMFNHCVFNAVIDAANSAAQGDLTAEINAQLGDNAAEANVTEVPSTFTNPKSVVDDMFADLQTSGGYILAFGIGLAALLGFLYLFFLRIPGVLCGLIWGLAFGIWFVFVAAGVFMMQNSQKWADEPEPRSRTTGEINAALYISYFLYGLAGLWTLMLLWLRKRINLAIGVTKEAAKAVNAMKLLIFYPIIQVAALLVFMIPWTIYATYLASSGDVVMVDTGTTTVSTFVYTDNTRYAGLYLLFVYFWTSEFIVALGQIVVAMSTASWYFCRNKSQIGNGTVLGCIKRSTIYHSGTAAFGSLVIAIIKTIRAVIAYFQKKAKDSGNKLLQAMLCCIQCCMWCLEKCMKFLNKNAYIQTAIYGYSFCKAARKAFFLIARNIVRVAAVAMVSEIVLILGKILVPFAAALAFYVAADAKLGDDLHGLTAPTVFTLLLAFFVANMFTEVFGMAISTILQCFIADEEMFDDVDKRFAEGSLAATIGKTNKGSTGKVGAAEPAVAKTGTAAEDLP